MSNYYYLSSSLPMLHFGARPPFSFEEFLKICVRLIPEEDFSVLSDLPKPDDYGLKEINPFDRLRVDTESGVSLFRPKGRSMNTAERIKNHILQEWVDFDSSLRNELAKVRMRKKNIDAFSDLHVSFCTDYTLSQTALSASRIPSTIDAERFLDEKRWQALDDLCQGHFFDLEFIICYAYKLLILERWERIRTADKRELTETALNLQAE